MLPFAFYYHPLLVTLIGFGTLLEAYSISMINRRWLSRRGKNEQQNSGQAIRENERRLCRRHSEGREDRLLGLCLSY